MNVASRRLAMGSALALVFVVACTQDFSAFTVGEATGGTDGSDESGGSTPSNGGADATGGVAALAGTAGLGASASGGVSRPEAAGAAGRTGEGAADSGGAALGGVGGVTLTGGGGAALGGVGGVTLTGGGGVTLTGGGGVTLTGGGGVTLTGGGGVTLTGGGGVTLTGGGGVGGAPEGGTAGVAGGGAPSGATAGTGPGGAAGSAGLAGAATGGSACGLGQKLCGETCLPNDDPATGCAASSCDPCVVPDGTATCSAGACAVASCDDGHLDCDGSAATGCETGWGSFTDAHCGGCGSSCSSQGSAGGLVCQNARCTCTSAGQCGTRGVYDCVSGACSCEGTVCGPGETCSLRSGPDSLCGCNGSEPCAAGNTCCPAPYGCRDLLVDADHCGACGWKCPVGTTCIDGTCT